MNQAGSTNNPNVKNQGRLGSFADALKEVEHSGVSGDEGFNISQTSLLSEALVKTGGKLPQENQEDLAKEQKNKASQRALHAEINSSENEIVVLSREEKVKEATKVELIKTRDRISAFSKRNNIESTNPEVGKVLLKEIAEPSAEGKGESNFLNKFEIGLQKLAKMINGKDKSYHAMAVGKQKKMKRAGDRTKTILNNQNNNELNLARGGA